MTEEDLRSLISGGETLSVEFKSDRNRLPDSALVEALAALANTNGGVLLEGVEDDGEITGLHQAHRDVDGIVALVENRTTPGLCVAVESVAAGSDKFVCVIRVPKSSRLIATSDGKFLRRRLDAHGKPEVVALKPADVMSWQSSLGLYDPSSLVLEGVEMSELDPVQRVRLRRVISEFGEEKSLLKLTDEELDKALGLCAESGGAWHPTLTGLLLLGTERLLKEHVPSHEAAFQVIKAGKVRVNEFRRKPLLEIFEEFSVLFGGQYSEEELDVGLFRVGIPNFDKVAFREAFVNALVHRDYNVIGTVYVQFDDLGLTISNPGGFIEGVTIENLLSAAPRSRNRCLADALKRIGLAERTGRGVDRIYGGLLRYGRPAPDYSETNSSCVKVRLFEGDADALFVRMLMKREDRGVDLPVDSLLVLSSLRDGEQTLQEISVAVKRREPVVRSVLGTLLKEGMIDQRVEGRIHVYFLGKGYHQTVGRAVDWTKMHGLSHERQVNMVCEHLEQHRQITCAQVMMLCDVERSEAKKLISEVRKRVKVRLVGHGRGARYEMEGNGN